MLSYSKHLAIAALLSSTNAAKTPGFGMSVTEAGVNKGKDVLLPYIFENIGDMHIDEVDFDGGYLKNIDVHIDQPASQNVKFNFLNADNGLGLLVNGAVSEINADFKYKWSFITVDGKANIKLKNIGVDVEIDAGTQESTPSYELAPKLDAKKFNINVNPDDIDITLTGGLVAKIANILIPLLKNSVIPQTLQQVEGTAKDMINGQIDDDLKIYGSQEEIPYLGGVTVDYAQIGGPQFTQDQVFQMGMNGTFFDSQHLHAPTGEPATYALHDPQGLDAQGYLTDFTVNSALESGFTTGNTLDLTYLLHEYLNVTVTTDNLGVLVPEVLTKYGSGKAVSLSGMFVDSPSTWKTTAGQASGTSNLQVTVSVEGEQAIQASFLGMAGTAELNAKSGKLYGKISESSIGQIDAASFKTTLGIDADQLQTEIQSKVIEAVGDANEQLLAGVVVPGADINVVLSEGYGRAGVSLTPQLW